MSGDGRFGSTIWDEVARARDGESAALSAFVNRYRPAIVGWYRRRGLSREDADDLTQDVFFQIVQGKVLSKVSPEKGRLRSLLLAIAKHVAANQIRARNRLKRGGDRALVPIDPADLPAPTAEEEETFDGAWMRYLMTAALADLEDSQPHHYNAVRLSLEGISQSEIAACIKCTVAAANNYVHRGKAFIRERVRALIADSCRSREDFDAEATHLSRYLE